MARPSKLKAEIVEKVVTAVRAGCPVEVAVVFAGIGASTFYEWRRRGLAGEAGFVEFVEEVERARAAAVVRHCATITEAGRKDWRASAWMLARSDPDRWGDKPAAIPVGEIEVTVR